MRKLARLRQKKTRRKDLESREQTSEEEDHAEQDNMIVELNYAGCSKVSLDSL